MWSKTIGSDAALTKPDTTWFQDAKFGIFMHWGLYSSLGNTYDGKNYYGSGEWIMNRAKIPAATYAALAQSFNPTAFDAKAFAQFAHDAGARYLVITAKHHEGFAMFDSKSSSFNIVQASPYGKDPMAALAQATAAEGIKFGFYYSQFLDWHEKNGGGNKWDFKESEKDYQKYYAEKSIPQIKELLSHYGPLGLVWFDMPGGLSHAQTVAFMGQVRALQPQCLVSSRVGQGLGDFRDFGDSELPPTPIAGPWEAIFTHNDSWGFVKSDQNFKTPEELIRLLASTSARGGNLMVNVGPDGTGRIPEKSLTYFRKVGEWLSKNGESIYGTTASPIPDQPWGVMTRKGSTLYLHVFHRPDDGAIVIPSFAARALHATFLGQTNFLPLTQLDHEVVITLPPSPESSDTVIALSFTGDLPDAWATSPAQLSRAFPSLTLDAASGVPAGQTRLQSKTSSRYFGNWKHDTCATAQTGPADTLSYQVHVREAGAYRISLDYASTLSSAPQGVVEIAGQTLGFEAVKTGEFDPHQPLLFLHHPLGIVTLPAGQTLPLVVRPAVAGPELFWLRRIVIEPVR